MLKKLIARRTKSTTKTVDIDEVLNTDNYNAAGGYPEDRFNERFGISAEWFEANGGYKIDPLNPVAVVYYYADGTTFLHYPCK